MSLFDACGVMPASRRKATSRDSMGDGLAQLAAPHDR